MFSCYVYRSKYIKYNRLYRVEHYHDLVWYCKMNFKTNLPKLETKKSELCLYSFKYINYKSEYQANSNTCPF